MLTAFQQSSGIALPLASCLDNPVTVRRLAAAAPPAGEVGPVAGTVMGESQPTTPHAPLVIPVRAGGHRDPLFIIYADAAGALSAPLGRALQLDRPVYVIAPIWTEFASHAELVEGLVTAIGRTVTGPLRLVGHSIGGLFAYEATPLLEASGQSVGALVLVDTLTPQVPRLVHPALASPGPSCPRDPSVLAGRLLA